MRIVKDPSNVKVLGDSVGRTSYREPRIRLEAQDSGTMTLLWYSESEQFHQSCWKGHYLIKPEEHVILHQWCDDRYRVKRILEPPPHCPVDDLAVVTIQNST